MIIGIYKADDRGDIVTLIEDLTVSWRDKTVTIPGGFKCDGASVPQFLWSSVTPAVDPRTLRGAVTHDYLYRTTPEGWSRKEADELFYDLIREDGLGWWASQKAYWGVRLFGASSWGGDNGTS